MRRALWVLLDSSVSCAVFRAHRSCPMRLPSRYDITTTHTCACHCHASR